MVLRLTCTISLHASVITKCTISRRDARREIYMVHIEMHVEICISYLYVHLYVYHKEIWYMMLHIVANCPSMAGTIPKFLGLSLSRLVEVIVPEMPE